MGFLPSAFPFRPVDAGRANNSLQLTMAAGGSVRDVLVAGC
jgi:hypothetical protein